MLRKPQDQILQRKRRKPVDRKHRNQSSRTQHSSTGTRRKQTIKVQDLFVIATEEIMHMAMIIVQPWDRGAVLVDTPIILLPYVKEQSSQRRRNL